MLALLVTVLPRAEILLLVGGSAGLLAAVSLLTRAMVRPADAGPLPRVLAHWLAMACVAISATLMREYRMALAVVFGTSVALLSIVPGALCFSGSHGRVPRRWSGVWLFAPVVAAMTFAAGLGGRLTWWEATALLLQGLIVMLSAKGDAAGDDLPTALRDPPIRWSIGRGAAIAAILCLLLVGAWAAVRGGAALALRDGRVSSTAIATGFLSAVLALPVIRSGTLLALSRRGWAAVNVCVLLVMLNLCVLLPAVVFLRLGQAWSRGEEVAALDYPLANWRIDALLLVVLSMWLVPVALGRLRPDWLTGTALVVLYGGYVLLTILPSGLG